MASRLHSTVHRLSAALLLVSVYLFLSNPANAFTFHPPNKILFNSRASSIRRHALHLQKNEDIETEFTNEKHFTAQPKPQQQQGLLSTAAATASLLLLLSNPLPANAGFGPSSGATTTPPPGLKSPETLLKGNDLQNNKKLNIAISSTLDERRLKEFNAQLDVIIDSLREKNENGGIDIDGDGLVDLDATALSRSTDTLEKARLLQTQIQSRQQLLDRLERQPYWFNYLAAFFGSICSTLVMHPVDTIKTRLMISANPENEDEVWDVARNDTDVASNFILKADAAHHPHPASNSTMTLTDTAHTATAATSNAITFQNFGSLYEGLTGNLMKEGPPSAVYLGVYETVKYALAPKVAASYLLLVYLIAGAAGELVGSVIRAPAEATKSLVQSRVTNSALEAVKQVLFTESGRATVARAWQASVFRDVPFGAVQLATFEFIKAFILNNPNIDFDSSTLQAEALIGAFAGGFGSFLTNPADVITTRIITAESNGEVADGEEPLDVFGWAKKIYEEEGLGAFFVGWQARVGYWAPAISIFLTCYCSVRQAGIANDWFP